MAPTTWPARLPFDPESGDHPPALEALFARPAATVPAVLLVVGREVHRRPWAARSAVAIADAWAARRDAITLADLDLETPALERMLGLEGAEGIADIFDFGLSLSLASRPVPGRRFRYLSAGLYVPDPQALLEDPRWEGLVFQHAEHEATLLALVPFDAPGLEPLARRVTRAIILAGADEGGRIAAGLPSNCNVLAVLHRPDDPAAARPDAAATVLPWTPRAPGVGDRPPIVDPVSADPVSEEQRLAEPSFVRRAPRRRRTSRALLFLLVVTLAAGGWTAAERYLGFDGRAAIERVLPPAVRTRIAAAADVLRARTAALIARIRGEAPPAAAAGGPGPDGPASAAGAPGNAAADPGDPVEAPLYYSVAVEAHPDFATATERVAALRRAEPDVAFYLTPIVWDSVIYYRVMAGLVADTVAAGELLRRLHGSGHKTDLDPWSVRPTVWTYHLGEFATRGAAVARADSLRARGVPSYIVEIPYTAGPPRFRLYAGAYEGPSQAELMARLLEKAGIEAELVRRTGPAAE
ncbi:MAG TPA: SPOR domain-containing protein [Longimicrobiales bacterium]